MDEPDLVTAESPTPTVTSADIVAEGVFELIEAIAARIPGLEAPHTTTRPGVRSARTVSREAVLSMIAAVEDQPVLQALGTFDVDEARAMLQFNGALRAVLLRLRDLTDRLSFTMEAKKARVVVSLLQTYDIAKGLARTRDGASLVHFLEVMRRELSRKNGSRARKNDEEQTG
jgi:hypothetical protein